MIDNSFVPIQGQPNGSSDFDRILGSIHATIGGILENRSTSAPASTAPAPAPMIAGINNNVLVLAVVAVGLYFLFKS